MAPRGNNRGFLHIKRRTEGTSNELSFSVLDAKSNTVEVPTNSPRTVTELGKVSLFTIPGKQDGQAAAGFGMAHRRPVGAGAVVSGGAVLAPQTEIAHRKRHRRLVRAFQVLGGLALVGVLAVAGFQYVSGVVEQRQMSQVAVLEAIDLIAQTDEAIIALDSAVTQPAENNAALLKEQLGSLAAAASLLDRAINSAESASTAMAASSGNGAASTESSAIAEVKKAAAARKDLIEKGREALVQANAAKGAADLAQQAWDRMIEGDALARKAADLVSADPADYEQSSETSAAAIEQFEQALVLVRRASTAYEQADFSLLTEYIEKRSAAQQNALAANASAQEREEDLESINAEAYNETEREAAELAEQLPDNPAQPVIDAYSSVGAEADAAYQEARGRASLSDAALRAYLESAGRRPR